MPKKERDIFDIMDEWIREMEEEFERIEREFMRNIKSGEVKQFGPYVYGFRVTVGPDGVPKVEEFGNVRKIRGKPMISEEIEPLADVIERDKEIKVIAEVPGVNKDDIKVKLTNNGKKLVITAKSEDKNYYKEIDLPAEVDEKSAKANYKNGVLEITLQKKSPSVSESGVDIKIE
ncbi:heat-shock protein Hsp20 [Sulfolobus sp. A20]|uniref:archaeal heat shock protein Hsp20 n=1 Tax=Saccharolobus sp. A20 TaxID=1891280 RepID=UPI000845FDE7|nr:archaeal heat shock protein Hsp20 [Sulfolobus sp. A20]TRM78404.1 Hsp20/alpha crystallin family protein [Sulfolobus sp. A20-N-F8]TRM81097.1 Hsp20/alpha crystallin family protein [Sulfolobus sp. D5]TRM83660.1 Hsp20/alpha crystallin family protein [Sulfolobus sp. A20-N-F6]TRM85187.1 Hsp20/alpha crystallin family protein [Sulfolobus sp. F3]TRM89111.1 Hsp20/alpha crystallin family protein [Sulfolobus sp. C3]TRN02623.1 Hsp20/alpha crystallin family protein [Sulfolobus sp. E1]